MCFLLFCSAVPVSCLLRSARSSAAWSGASSRLPPVPRSLSAVLLAGMRWRCSPWRCVARLRGSRSSALGMRLARASGASRLSPWFSPWLRLARLRSGSRAVLCRPRWGSGWRRVRALPSCPVASRSRSRAGSSSRPSRAALSLRPARLRLRASRSSSSVAGGILLCSLRCCPVAGRGSRCSVARSSAASCGSRPALCCPRGPRSAARRAAVCRGVRSRRLAVRPVLARPCSRAVRSARWASAGEVPVFVGRAALCVARPLFSPNTPSDNRQVIQQRTICRAVTRRGVPRREPGGFTHANDGKQYRPPRCAMATAALLKRRSSLVLAASALRSVGGCDLNDAIGDCRRVFSLSHPISRDLNSWEGVGGRVN